ncbi:MAG: hypothetical protein L3J39_02195 [Verrucomicrobiales bacterium]|nr:hypothetical protein [Verrucomicrobiales bacterium]
MKRSILFTVIVGALLVLVYSWMFIPGRFRLRSSSPSGEANVFGLAFRGSKPHVLDGKLRLFVRDKEDMSGVWTTKIQTNIEWGRDLNIVWKKAGALETFAIKKSDEEMLEFMITDDGVKCTSGRKFLAPDPYATAEQGGAGQLATAPQSKPK